MASWLTSGNEHPRIDPGRRIYAIGDIHGRLDLLIVLAARIEADLAASPVESPSVVFLGDYVDRGADSRGVVEFLLSWTLGGIRPVCLRGNHEQMLLDFLTGRDDGQQWFSNGGLATLASYSLTAHADAAAFDAVLPPSHRGFVEALQLTHEAGDYLFVHAGIRPGVPLACQRPDDLMWIRDPFYAAPSAAGRYVVHGHTPVEAPLLLDVRADIDTGAWYTGQLTCLAVEGEERRIL